MEAEILYAIPNFDAYSITPSGRVFSLKNNRWGLSDEWREMAVQSDLETGYLHVEFSRDGRRHKKYIHDLLLTVFVSPRPPGLQCRHLNSKGWDNRLENLCWGTQSEQEHDKIAVGRDNRGERHGNHVLTEKDVHAIRQRFRSGEPRTALAFVYGVSRACVYDATRRRTWKHV